MNDKEELKNRLNNFKKDEEQGWSLSWLEADHLDSKWGSEKNLKWLDALLEGKGF